MALNGKIFEIGIFFKCRNPEKDNEIDPGVFFCMEMALSPMEKVLTSYSVFSVNH